MSVKYIHVRDFDSNDRPKACGGTTVAYDLDGNTVKYSFCRCHERDHYNKEVGRAKSGGRLRSPRLVHSFSLEGNDPIVVQVLNHVFVDIQNEIETRGKHD